MKEDMKDVLFIIGFALGLPIVSMFVVWIIKYVIGLCE